MSSTQASGIVKSSIIRPVPTRFTNKTTAVEMSAGLIICGFRAEHSYLPRPRFKPLKHPPNIT